MIKGVITADIVGSTQIKEDERGALPKLINQLSEEITAIAPLRVEIFRGDSFQVLVEEAEKAPLVAILFRAGLKKSGLLADDRPIDARLSVGIGAVSYLDEKISQSDGEAFVLSGRGFDALEDKQRLKVQTFSSVLNEELKVETAFVDDIVTNWTNLHSETLYEALLTNASQGEMAQKTKTSQQNISKRLEAAKAKLVRMYLDRVETLIVGAEKSREEENQSEKIAKQ